MKNKNINININKKLVVSLIALTSFFSGANYVALTSSQDSGGISLIQEFSPVGSIMMWSTNTAPEGWLELNGQSTIGHPELAALIGEKVPDFRGQFVRAWDNSKGIDSGRSISSIQSDSNKAHSHTVGNKDLDKTFSTSTDGNHSHTYNSAVGGPTWGSDPWSGSPSDRHGSRNSSTNGNHNHNVRVDFGSHDHSLSIEGENESRPTNIAIMYIIKSE